MTKIKPTYVTFEQAKLINYPFLTDFGYSLSGNIIERKGFIATNGWINMPEQWQVVEWFRRTYGIWIEVLHRGDFDDFTFKVVQLDKNNCKKHPHYIHNKGFSTPQEAYSAAFDYTLNKLI